MIYGRAGDGREYTYGGLDDLQEAVDETVRYLTEHAEKFDFIAVRGISGLVVGSPVSLALDKPLVIVRKGGEDSHSGSQGGIVNSARAEGRYVFLDDFVSLGSTRNAVRDALSNQCPKAQYAGTYCYHANRSGTERSWAQPTKTEQAEAA